MKVCILDNDVLDPVVAPTYISYGAMFERLLREAGADLPAITFTDADGKATTPADFAGQGLVINLWATWCPPCRKEIPDFAAASQSLAGEPVQFIGLSIDSADKVRAFRDEFKVPYPLLIAGPEVLTLAAGFGNEARALPFTLIIDRDGKVRHIKLGTLKREELEGKIRALLAS